METRTRRYWFPKHYADEVQRLRVPLGFILVAMFGWWADPVAWSTWMGVPVSLIGLWIRGWAAGHLAKNESLATTGPFAHVRNPLYLGTLIVALGLALAARQPGLAALFGAAFVFVYLPAVELEEQHLRKLFPEYGEYAEQVAMLVPRWKTPFTGSGKFRWTLYRKNQEYKALLGLAAGISFLLWRSGLIIR